MNLQILLPYICFVVGICILVLGIVIRNKIKDSKSWPKTNGVIIESTIQSEWVRSGSGRIYVVCPKVIYEYQVDGKNYTSSQLALIEHNSADENLARGKAEKYSPRQYVEVYYNPRKPSFAVLEMGGSSDDRLSYGIIVLGITLAISGVVWICASQH
jgi:hypothetical protein